MCGKTQVAWTVCVWLLFIFSFFTTGFVIIKKSACTYVGGRVQRALTPYIYTPPDFQCHSSWAYCALRSYSYNNDRENNFLPSHFSEIEDEETIKQKSKVKLSFAASSRRGKPPKTKSKNGGSGEMSFVPWPTLWKAACNPITNGKDIANLVFWWCDIYSTCTVRVGQIPTKKGPPLKLIEMV